MFRSARVTFRTSRHGGETRTDTFRVWVASTDTRGLIETEVRYAVHSAGERDFEIIEWSWTD